MFPHVSHVSLVLALRLDWESMWVYLLLRRLVALFRGAKPMGKTNMITQVRNGFRAAGTALLGLGWLGLVIAGLGEAFTPPGRPIVGWALLAVAAIILVATAHSWVKALPGILGLATLNALVSILLGHATNLPSVPISRSESIVATLFLAISTAMSPSFTVRGLRVVDRLAFLIYASCIFWGAVDHRVRLSVQMGFATFCLFSAWGYDRIERRRGHGATDHHLGGTASAPTDRTR
jgi:hypothetical protein